MLTNCLRASSLLVMNLRVRTVHAFSAIAASEQMRCTRAGATPTQSRVAKESGRSPSSPFQLPFPPHGRTRLYPDFWARAGILVPDLPVFSTIDVGTNTREACQECDKILLCWVRDPFAVHGECSHHYNPSSTYVLYKYRQSINMFYIF